MTRQSGATYLANEMSEDIGGRLLRASVVDRGLLARARARAAAEGLPLAVALVDEGVDEMRIGALLVEEGFGPLLDAVDLAASDDQVRRRLSPTLLRNLLAVPLRYSPAGFVIAMADPSDARAVAEVRASMRADVLPTAALISDLRVYVDRLTPSNRARAPSKSKSPSKRPSRSTRGKSAAPGRARSEAPSEAPIELVRLREHAAEPRRRSEPEPIESVVPLVRAKPKRHGPTTARPEPKNPLERREGAPQIAKRDRGSNDTTTYAIPKTGGTLKPPAIPAGLPGAIGQRRRRLTPGFEEASKRVDGDLPPATRARRPSVRAAAPPPRRSAPPKRSTTQTFAMPDPAEALPPGRLAKLLAPAKPRKSERPKPQSPEDRWGNLTDQQPVPHVPPPSSIPPGEIGSLCASMRVASDRDAVIRLACEGALTVGRGAAFLAVRKGMLEVRHATAIAATIEIQNVKGFLLPLSGQSLLRSVVESGVTYLGPHGARGTDKLLREAVQSIGGEVLLAPITAVGKVIGVLCVDGLMYRGRGRERVERLAESASEAFERILRKTKKK